MGCEISKPSPERQQVRLPLASTVGGGARTPPRPARFETRTGYDAPRSSFPAGWQWWSFHRMARQNQLVSGQFGKVLRASPALRPPPSMSRPQPPLTLATGGSVLERIRTIGQRPQDPVGP